MSWVAAGVASAGLTLSAVKWISSNSKEKKARKAREKLQRPLYDIQDEYFQNKNLANELAQGGLPAASKDYYTEESQRGLTAGIQGILGSGGNPNDVQKIFETYDRGLDKIATADAQTHIDNIRYYMGVNKDLAGQKTIKWAVDKQQPYLNTLKELSAAQAAGQAMKQQAANDAMSSITSFATSMGGGSGAGGFGKGGGGKTGGTAGSGSMGATGSNGGGVNYARAFQSFGGDSTQRNNSTVADPFGSNAETDEMQQYYLWKRMQGKI